MLAKDLWQKCEVQRHAVPIAVEVEPWHSRPRIVIVARLPRQPATVKCCTRRRANLEGMVVSELYAVQCKRVQMW